MTDPLLTTAADLITTQGWCRHGRRHVVTTGALTLTDALAAAAGTVHPTPDQLATTYSRLVDQIRRQLDTDPDPTHPLRPVLDQAGPGDMLTILDAYNAHTAGLTDVLTLLTTTAQATQQAGLLTRDHNPDGTPTLTTTQHATTDTTLPHTTHPDTV